MLVLSRRVGQRLIINDNVTVEVMSVSGDSVRLGIIAPREINVHREEVYLAITAANKEASAASKNASSEAITNLAKSVRSRKSIEPAE
ncbi:MAG: carbon storage regulator CsrA [Pyrinomonadaceae bacterium]